MGKAAKAIWQVLSAAGTVHWLWGLPSGGLGGAVVAVAAAIAGAPVGVVILLGVAAFCAICLAVLVWRERRPYRKWRLELRKWNNDYFNCLNESGYITPKKRRPSDEELERNWPEAIKCWTDRSRPLYDLLHDGNDRGWIDREEYEPRMRAPENYDELWDIAELVNKIWSGAPDKDKT